MPTRGSAHNAAGAKAVFLIHDLRLGGAERVFVGLVAGIDTPRPIPTLVRGEIAMELPADLESAIRVLPGPGADLDLTAGPARRRIAPRGPLSLWVKTRGLLDLCEREEAAVVSTFLHKSHVIGLCARWLSGGRIRVALNAHEFLSHHLVHQHRGVGRIFYRWFARRYFRDADRVIAVAAGVGDDLVRRFGVPPDRLVVIPNAVDVERLMGLAPLPPDPWPAIPEGARIALGVGRLVRLKGFDLLLEAIARLRPEVHGIVAGEGEQEHALRERARRLGIEDRMHFVGRVDNPWAFMARADVLVVPSRTEAAPTVIDEAHAIGTPVVATDCAPGVNELLEGGHAGVLVPPEDAEALADGIDRVLGDRGLATRLASRGRARVVDLRPESICARYAAVIEELAG